MLIPFHIPTQRIGTTPPSFRAVGTAAGGVGAVTPGLPTGYQENDILLLFTSTLETPDESPATPSGWTALPGLPTANIGLGNLYLHGFWKRASSSETAPTLPDKPHDHIYAVMLGIKDCITSGNPWDTYTTGGTLTEGAEDYVDTTAGTTSLSQSLIVSVVANNFDISTGWVTTAPTNASQTGLTKHHDDGTTAGFGGGLAIVTGTKSTAGNYGVTRLTGPAGTFLGTSPAIYTVALVGL